MNKSPDKSDGEGFAALGRSLGASRGGQLFVSFLVAALSCSLAYAAWHAPDLSATILTIGVLVYGLERAWRLLPFSRATRDRWAHELQVAERCPACSYRSFLWVGFGIAVFNLCRASATQPFDYSELITPGLFIVVGTFSYIRCRRFIRNDRKP